MTRQWRLTLPAALLALCSAHAAAQHSDEDELALSYGDPTLVSIATGSALAITRAPATATVITAQDIVAMGATEFDQVLAAVPGLHVSVSHIAYNPIYSFRGSFTNYNPQVLMLVNGQPITNVFGGNRSYTWGGMPVENIARIEVIRGPGSALYGADAYSGVINVITKSAAELDGLEFGLRSGSFNTRDAWLQTGGAIGPVRAALYLRAGHSDGHGRTVDADLQSSLDRVFGTTASLAPGPVSLSRKALDLRAEFSVGNVRWRTGFQRRRIGFGAGLAESLDPAARSMEERLYSDLSYEKINIVPHWDLSATLGYQDIDLPPADPGYLLFPRGAFGGAFPDGVVGNPGHSERTASLSVSLFYTGFDRHRLRIGAGHRTADLYAVPEFKNFNLVVMPGAGPVFVPLGGVIESTHIPELAYITPHKRHLHYLFVQDEWTLARDWSVTAGVRHDRYSDFGATTNPRLALVWDLAYNVVLKAMHGRAFRAPSLTEQYTRNNPVNTGNPSIRPETIATSELALLWQALPTVSTSATLFRYRMRDIIAATTNADASTGKTFRNTGDQTGRGIELEAAWNPSRTLRVTGHLSLQRSVDEATGKNAGLAPQQRLFARADWRFHPSWLAGALVNHVADRAREPGDLRAPIADYTTADVTLQREHLFGKWALRATVQNLFNADAREPSIAPGNITFDLPLARRSFHLQLSRAM
jgi:outer membrane receptor for ferrienterochelin and colicins